MFRFRADSQGSLGLPSHQGEDLLAGLAGQSSGFRLFLGGFYRSFLGGFLGSGSHL